jgi:hypothetical protein
MAGVQLTVPLLKVSVSVTVNVFPGPALLSAVEVELARPS